MKLRMSRKLHCIKFSISEFMLMNAHQLKRLGFTRLYYLRKLT